MAKNSRRVHASKRVRRHAPDSNSALQQRTTTKNRRSMWPLRQPYYETKTRLIDAWQNASNSRGWENYRAGQSGRFLHVHRPQCRPQSLVAMIQEDYSAYVAALVG